MKLLFFTFGFLILSTPLCSSKEEGIQSKASAQFDERPRCPYSLRKLWHIEISSFPFSAPPLVADVDGDGGLDIVVAPFGETITVIEGESGKHLHGSNWPQQNLDKSVYSSPLQFDIDRDGVLDILIVTSSGEGLFYTRTGQSLLNFSFELSPAYVQAKWYNEKVAADENTVSQYVSAQKLPSYIPVDPHVLSTPVLHHMRYLVFPVSYYYSSEDYSDPLKEKPWGSENIKDKFYITGVVTLDLIEFHSLCQEKASNDKKMTSMKTYFLELHQTPVFGLFTPTVINFDGDFGESEIVHGSTSGNLFVLGLSNGQYRKGFPQNFGSISGRVSAVDIDGDGILELFILNTSGTVACLDAKTGKIKWTAELESSSFAGSRAVDVNLDGSMDIVLATDNGDVYALHGANGSVMANYPYKTGSRISGNIVTTKLKKNKRGPLDLMFLSDNGILHILASDQSCLTKVALGDASLVDIVSNDVMLMNQGLEFLVATSDGSLICLGSGVETSPHELVEKDIRLSHHKFVFPGDGLSQNDFTSSPSKVTVFIEDSTRSLKEVTGNSFYLDFSVQNLSPRLKYNLDVYLGSDVVYHIEQIVATSIPRWLKIHTPDQPGEGFVTVVITDSHGFSYSDSVFLRFNKLILLDLQWLLVTPFIAMVIILLVNHGFPAKDLLPVTFPFKSK